MGTNSRKMINEFTFSEPFRFYPVGRMECGMNSHPRPRDVPFHVERDRGKLTDRSAERLPVGQAALVIGGLSLLSWMIIVGIVVACRAIM